MEDGMKENLINNEEPVRIKLNDDKQDNNKNESKCNIDLGGDIMFGITFLGRIILTLYSFHGLFFILNFIIQYIILVPGYLYEIKSPIFRCLCGIMYLL